ncbi:3'-5' exonuclease [Nocardioides salsibiostraticola]
MPQVILTTVKDGQHDGSIHKQTMSFLYKLGVNDAQPGLHIEPIMNSVDSRVRTGRVNDMYRAVLFKVQGSGPEAHYVFTGVWPHDEAIAIAQSAVLKSNPVNGITEMLIQSESELDKPKEDDFSVEPATAPAPQDKHSLLESVSAGTTVDSLVEALGLDADLATRAMAASSDDEILKIAEHVVEWQGMALLDLAAGKTIDEARTTLGLDKLTGVDDSLDEDDQLIEGMKTPAAKMQFAFIEDQEELREIIEEGDFAKWRVFLHPEQRKYVDGSWNGPYRLSGGAGTGKTVVLLHRARKLAQRSPKSRIVLTTYTKNLAADLSRNLKLLDPDLPIANALGEPGIYVTGVDAAAGRVLAFASASERDAAVEKVLGVGGNRATKRPDATTSGWREAIEATGEKLPADLRNPSFFEAEYAAVVLPARITTREQYLKVRRTGRGVSLSRGHREAVWETISHFRTSAAVEGVVDFPEVAAIAAELLAASGPRADHVLVDEGQDLAPSQWQMLRGLAPEGPDDLFIAEDLQQRIYGQRVVFSRLGINIVGRSRRLSLNYRTTQQVLQFATSVLEGLHDLGLEEEDTDDKGYRSARSGPAPEKIGAKSLTEELDAAATRIQDWLANDVVPETIGILVRDQQVSNQITAGLSDRGVQVRQITKQQGEAKAPQVMTMHRAKGMEFSRVLIFGADADLVPAAYLLKGVPEGDREDLLQRERSLFYVAATRARDELVVMWSGDSSEFLARASQ